MPRDVHCFTVLRSRVRMWFQFVSIVFASLVSNMRKGEQVKTTQLDKRGLSVPNESNKNGAVSSGLEKALIESNKNGAVANGLKEKARERPRLVLDLNSKNRKKAPAMIIPPIPTFESVQARRRFKEKARPRKRQEYEEIQEGKGLVYDDGLIWEATPKPRFMGSGKGILRKEPTSATESEQAIQKETRPVRHVAFSSEPHHVRYYFSERMFARESGPEQQVVVVEKRKGQPKRRGKGKTPKVSSDILKIDKLTIK